MTSVIDFPLDGQTYGQSTFLWGVAFANQAMPSQIRMIGLILSTLGNGDLSTSTDCFTHGSNFLFLHYKGMMEEMGAHHKPIGGNEG
jgi:hypothetical protein